MKIGHCAGCFQVCRLTRHHLKPRRQGGSDQAKNLVNLCRPCHDKEERAIERGHGFRHPAMWRRLQEKALKLDQTEKWVQVYI